MKRRTFIKNSALAGAAIAAAPLTRGLSFAAGLSEAKPAMPSVHLTQQDFVSTFPWGIRGDKVRILQQEVENELLDAETLAAFAFMAGSNSASSRLDEAWTVMLNSQNHDVHVVLADEAGIEWCKQARLLAGEIRENALQYLTGRIGGPAIAFNTLPWTRKSNSRPETIPGFGYSVVKAEKNIAKIDNRNVSWNDWFDTGAYKVRLLEDGSLEAQMGADSKNIAKLGYLTVFTEGQMHDSRSDKPKRMQSWLSNDHKQACAEIEGEINGILYLHKVVVTGHYIDYETTFDYGNGRSFGPEPADSEVEPRRTHYYQHERKLCMNCEIPNSKTRLLQNSPFLTWPSDRSKSVESLHYVALESGKGNIAHFNLGQSGYGYDENNSSIRHVLAFAPQKYVYGRGKQTLKGKETHHSRFMPFAGDWRKAKLTLLASEYQRPLIRTQPDKKQSELPEQGSFLQVDSNTTTATALFERGGKLYVRLWEWAGQKDKVSLHFGAANDSLVDCTHSLREINKLASTFSMRPWEIKTVELVGSPKILKDTNQCCRVQSLSREPEGWSRKNYFISALPKSKAAPQAGSEKAFIYFASGYHDGMVRPMERHSKTMAIEMQRVRSAKYPNYASFWEIGGSCWVRMHVNEPEYLESLKPFIKEGSIELVGGTWCEPLFLIISGESVMRQFLYGLEAIEKYVDGKVTIYCNQEHGTFAQMPQVLRSFGLKAVVNRTQWAPYGYESGLDADVAEWIGVDGSTIYVVPRYTSMDYLTLGPNPDKELQHGSVTGHNRVWRTEEKFKQMRDEAFERGIQKPLMTMLEDIWSEEWRSTDMEMDFYASLPCVKFTSLARYLEMFGIKV
jgi:hypothetical protein